MGRVDGNRGQKRIDLALEVIFGKRLRLFVKFLPIEQEDALFTKLREQMPVPALVLRRDKGVNLAG